MKPLLSTLLLLISFLGKAQNLVMNPSFEEYYTCPTGWSNEFNCKYIFNPMCANSQFNCNSTPDYYNACASFQSGVNVPNVRPNSLLSDYREAHEGNAFIGIVNVLAYKLDGSLSSTNREFVQVKLSEPLVAGKQYTFSFYAGANQGNLAFLNIVSKLGICFVKDSIIYQSTPLWQFMTPDWVSNDYITDYIGWQKLNGTYIANGGEKWLIIGIFDNNMEFDHLIVDNANITAKTCYTYLDDFYMEEKIEQPSTPTITTTPATCTENGSASISNFDTLNTYTFSPPGPTVDSNGDISGMLPGTSYTVTTNDGTNDSDPSDAFTIEAQLPAVPAPTVTSPQSFCDAASIADLMPFSMEYKWYNVANGGTVLPTNEMLISGTYYVSQTIDGCESDRAMVDVVIKPLPNVTVSPNMTICTGTTISLTASGANSYIWSPTNETTNSISVSPISTTTYTVIGTTDGCSDSTVVTVTVFNHPVASFSTISDTVFVPSQVNFTNTSSNATNYSWFLDSVYQTSSTHFTINISQEGTYSITLIATNGVCPSDTTSKTMYAILLPPFVNPPNVFSPNNDGVNDNWVFEGTIKSIIILNRWGNVVFSADKDFNGWNGKDKMGNACSDGVYFYQIVDDQGIVHTSFITLLR